MYPTPPPAVPNETDGEETVSPPDVPRSRSGRTRRAVVAEVNPQEECKDIVTKLQILYKSKLRPLEQMFEFPRFHSESLTDTDLSAKPIVLLVGGYSVGKTSFIKYLLERDFPGARIGPEPTTDRFTAIMYGKKDRIIPGNALAADQSYPFTGTRRYGMAFLNRFEASICPSRILKRISFVDTPGVLSGEKQRVNRGYDFAAVVEWFAERSDRILLLFDAHKLDISDEFKQTINALRSNDDKIRVVLNKADMEEQMLMRVYGALMWSLGKVLNTPEVMRVYVGSFWEEPLKHTENQELIEQEMKDLLSDLRGLPRNSMVRKINELVKRARMAYVHAHLVAHLRDQFGWFGKEKTQEKLMKGLSEEYRVVQAKFGLPKGDFPDIRKFRDTIKTFQIHKFPRMPERAQKDLIDLLGKDIPQLMQELPGRDGPDESATDAGVAPPEANPFFVDPDEAVTGQGWAIDQATKAEFDNEFNQCKLSAEGKLGGADAKNVLLATGLPKKQLRAVWTLADIDLDGALDSEEFAVARCLINKLQSGELKNLPEELPADMIPPSKRHLFQYE